MEKQKCRDCSKVIEGYTKEHVAFLMWQHQQKHKRRAEAVSKTADASNNLNKEVKQNGRSDHRL